MKRLILLIAFLFHTGIQAADFKFFAGNSNLELANAVADQLGLELSHAQISHFNDGEIRIKIDENVRNCDVFIMQSTCSTQEGTVNDNLLELYLLIRAMKRASANHVTAIIPYYGYARQDRKTSVREPISASDIAYLLEAAGADHVIAVDLHCGQIQGFFHQAPVDNIFAAPTFVQYMSDKSDLCNPVVISPDAGGVERAKKFLELLSAKGIDANLAVFLKHRAGAGVIDKMVLVGSVEGCDAIIVDDICDTAGTLVHAAHVLKEHGANRVFACITHPVFSGPALERIAGSDLTELVVTDTIPKKLGIPSNIVQLSIAPLIAKAIQRAHGGESLSALHE